MARSGPIVLVDDDEDDEQLLREALNELGIENSLVHFEDCEKAFEYLKATDDKPFLILSDVNMPKLNGIEFKRKIDADPLLRSKSIPFVFFSTSVNKMAIDIAYKEMTVQGYFQKANNFQELKLLINLIIDYWKVCHHPNS